MSNKRLMMQGKLQELQQKRRELVLRADGLMESITNDLALYEVTKLVEIDTERVRVLACELDQIRRDVIKLDQDIKRLEAELG